MPAATAPLGQSQPTTGLPGSSPDPSATEDLPEASATLDPPCVIAGDKVVLTVDTGAPYSGVVYLAYYAGGKNGADPPFGDGYGGNRAGPSDPNGRYIDAWIVRPDAPLGPARVDVSILYRTRQRQSLTIPFRVTGVGDVAGADGC